MLSTTMPPATDTPVLLRLHGTPVYPCIPGLDAPNARFEGVYPMEVFRNEVLRNDLLDQGCTSVGSWPCTERPTHHDDPRSSRWTRPGKMERGLNRRTPTRLPAPIR